MPEKPPAADARSNIESVLHEDRKFECPEHFRQQAHIKSLEDYERIYRESVEQPEKFWAGIANELHWFKKWD
jgi:acetyl-CoA synthetase